jgi:hypothetical protein
MRSSNNLYNKVNRRYDKGEQRATFIVNLETLQPKKAPTVVQSNWIFTDNLTFCKTLKCEVLINIFKDSVYRLQKTQWGSDAMISRLILFWEMIVTYSENRMYILGARGRIVGWGTMLQAERSRFWVPIKSVPFLNVPNSSSRTLALGSTQPLTEMSTRNSPGE